MSSDLLPLNEKAAGLLREHMREGPVLLCDAVWPAGMKPRPALWRRRGAATDFGVWEKTYSGVLCGLPRARDELLMHLHLAAGRLAPDGVLVLFGLKDAGIATAEKALHAVFEAVTPVLAKHHGRVFLARQPKTGLRQALEDWRITQAVRLGGEEVVLASYPGMFAAGALDAASALLIGQLGQVARAPKLVMDFACGTGILGLAARRRWPEARLSLIDHDALALRAAAANVPDAEFLQGESLAAGAARYDLIVSNPPIHVGSKQDYSVVEALVTEVGAYLARGGRMLLVTQQTVPVQRWAKVAETLAQEDGFKVWHIAA